MRWQAWRDTAFDGNDPKRRRRYALPAHSTEMPAIVYERRDQVAIARLNRPEELNALTAEMTRDLSELFTNLSSQPELRVIILTGAGNAFCAGTDVAELAALDENQARKVSEHGPALCDQIENCRVPVIAAIHGIAAGSGLELALACHIRIASDNAQFSLPEIKFEALAGHRNAQRLAREIGEELALEMMTGRKISAAEALRVGLVNRVVPAAEMLAQAEGLAGDIAKLAPLAIRACLEAVTQGTQLSLAEGLALESKLFARLFDSDDVGEGTSAFLEKRTPAFKGE